MNGLFEFNYHGCEVKAYFDHTTNEVVIDDFKLKIANVNFTMADFSVTENLNLFINKLEREALKIYNDKDKSWPKSV